MPIRPARSRSRTSISDVFTQWLGVRDQSETLADRAKELRDQLVDWIAQRGAEDGGSQWLELTEPISFTDRKGRTHVYTALKRERHLLPATPTPDPDKAIELLKQHKLWLSKADQKLLEEIGLTNPYVRISVDVDPDAVAQAYFKGLISDTEYDAILVEQRESYQFRPQES